MTGKPVEPPAGDPSRPPDADAEQPNSRVPADPGLTTQTVIEATTGAPLTAFPQRAPLATPPTSGGPSSGLARAGALGSSANPPGQPGSTRSGRPAGSGSPWADPVPPARAGSAAGVAAVPAGSRAIDQVVDEPEDEAEDFWLPIEEVHWDGTPVTPTPRRWWFRRDESSSPRTRAARRRLRGRRHPALGLAGLLLFALLGTFFAWVGAEPLWLAFGHGHRGTATVVDCTGSGLRQQCRGDFTAAGDSFTAWEVRLAGVGPDGRASDTVLPARMIGPESGTAYVGTSTGPLHLRWSLGFTLALLSGAAIGWATGALRLPAGWPRRVATLAGLIAPLLMAAGFLVAALPSP